MRLTGKVILIIAVTVTTIISIIFYVLASRFETYLESTLLTNARSLYRHIVLVRNWVSDYEGVFVKKKPGMASNPFLPHPDLITSDGDTLTLKNPALITRELSELSDVFGGNFSFHMASKNYINPYNQPDSFEFKALVYFEDTLRSNSMQEFYREEEINGEPHFRYFAPLYMQESCVSCHSAQGYKVGDLRGGVSILISTSAYHKIKKENWIFFLSFALATIVFMSALMFVALRKSVIRPLRIIENSAQKIKDGDYDFHLELPQKDEIGTLASSFEAMRQKIQSSTQQLTISEEKYRSLIEHSIEAIAIIDANGVIVESNHKFRHLTAYTSEALESINFHELIDSKNRNPIKVYMEDESKAEHFETTLFSRDKLEIPVEIYMIKGFSVGSESDLAFVYVRDLSERKKIEQYSIQAEKMFALGQISSGIAHEVRNPLFALNNNIDYLREKIACVDEDCPEIFSELKDGVTRIHKIVSEILDFARPHIPGFKPVKISRIIEDSLILVKKKLEKSAIRLECDFQDDQREVEADPHQLEQVFINLFLNAFQAMERAGVLHIKVESLDSLCRIDISDTGVGIPKDEITRIFDPFYTKSPNGTGLGLAIVQRILDQHSAKYEVESEPNLGTTFTIWLPYTHG